MHLRFRSQRPAAISYQQTYNVRSSPSSRWNGALPRRRSSSSISSTIIYSRRKYHPPSSSLFSFFFRHSSASCPVEYFLPSFSLLSPSLETLPIFYSARSSLLLSRNYYCNTRLFAHSFDLSYARKNFNRFARFLRTLLTLRKLSRDDNR